MKFTHYTLAEPSGPGVCPVCKQDWSADPNLECCCTRAHSNEEAQMQAAYLVSALCRAAKFTADQHQAGHRTQAATPSVAEENEQGQAAAAASLARSSHHPAHRRAG